MSIDLNIWSWPFAWPLRFNQQTFAPHESHGIFQFTPCHLIWFDHQCVLLQALERIGRPSAPQREFEKCENKCVSLGCHVCNKHITQHDKWMFGCMLGMPGCILQIISSHVYSYATDVASGTIFISNRQPSCHWSNRSTTRAPAAPVHVTLDPMLPSPPVGDGRGWNKLAARAVCPVPMRRLWFQPQGLRSLK